MPPRAPAAVADSATVAPAERPRLLVTGLAGSTLYLSIEALPPLALRPGQVFDVAETDAGPPVGRMATIEQVGGRVLARFEDVPFALTRGDVLYLVDAPVVATERVDRSDPTLAARPTPQRRVATVRGPRLSGMLSLESDLRRSTSRFTGTSDGTIDRTFTTPGGRLRATLSGLPAGIRVHTSLRAYNRDRDSRRPVAESRVQVFEAYASVGPETAPLRLQGGRFLNRNEAFMGYWDGAMLRLGSRRLAVGAMAGWEPTLLEERLDRSLFKYGGFLGVELGRSGARYHGSLSAVRTAPGTLSGTDMPSVTTPARTIIGAAQRLTAGAVRLYANVEAEQDTSGTEWGLARAHIGTSIRMGRLTLRGNASRVRGPTGLPFDPNLDTRREGPRLGLARDRVGGGVSLRVGAGSVGGDVTLGRDRMDQTSRTYASHLMLPQMLPGQVGLSLNGFYWEDESDNAVLSGFGALSRRFGGVRAEVGYRLDRSARSGIEVVSHGLQISISVQGSTGWSYHMNGFARRGADLETDRLYSRLSRSF